MFAIVEGTQQADDGGRVQAAGEHGADRHVAAHSQPDRIDQQLAKALAGVLEGRPAIDMRGVVPIALRRSRSAPRRHHVVRRGKPPDAEAEVLGARRDAGAQQLRHRGGIDSGQLPANRQQRLDFGREQQPTIDHGVVERLDAESIPGTEQRVAAPVVDGECPHAVQVGADILAPLPIGRQQHFRIRLSAEPVPKPLQFVAQFQVVEDLPVVGEHQFPVGGLEGLIARRVQIDDGQPNVRQADAAVVQPRARRVRAPMRHGRKHRRQFTAQHRPSARQRVDAGYAAHGRFTPARPAALRLMLRFIAKRPAASATWNR